LVHRYFSESPFFDPTTKNGLHFLHARTNYAEHELVGDRARFEEVLRRGVGVEYLVSQEPVGEGSGVWGIRKQDRRRGRGGNAGEDEVTTLGTWYTVGETIYQAPSVGDVIGNRILAAATQLSKFFETAKKLPTFDAATGYSYLPHTQLSSTANGTAASSAQHSPSRSREASVLPSADTQSLRSTSLALPEHPSSATTTSASQTAASEARLLAQSFRQALEFDGEYMDENPLIGEPGHFTFTSSLAAVKKRKAADEEAASLAAKAAKAKLELQEGKQKGVGAGREGNLVVKMEEGVVSAPPAVMSEGRTGGVAAREKVERRGSRMGERKRRTKSRANVGGGAVMGEGGAT